MDSGLSHGFPLARKMFTEFREMSLDLISSGPLPHRENMPGHACSCDAEKIPRMEQPVQRSYQQEEEPRTSMAVPRER